MAQPERLKEKTLDVDQPVAAGRKASVWRYWPTGLIALAFIALAWYGVYLIWRGVSSVFGF